MLGTSNDCSEATVCLSFRLVDQIHHKRLQDHTHIQCAGRTSIVRLHDRTPGCPATRIPTLSVFNRLPTVGYTQGGKFWVEGCRDQELEGARNTKLRQVRAARSVTPYVLYGGLYCL
jgi:hypothetical protein